MFQDDGSSKFLHVVHASQVFEIVNAVHVHELKHSGYKKVIDYVSMGRSSQFVSLLTETYNLTNQMHQGGSNHTQ